MTSDDSTVSILVADDNPILLEGMERALTAHGYAVQTAADGAAVLELLDSTTALPDLLLLDVMMPKLSGLEVLRAVQADARWSHLPVLLVTALMDENLPRQAREEGAAEVLIKPFRLADLLGMIELHARAEQAQPAIALEE